MSAKVPRPLLFEGQEQRLAALDSLARKLWLGGLAHSQGCLEPRLESLATLRREVVAGRLPPAEAWLWPPAPLAGALHEVITRLGLAGYCEGQQDLTDTVVLSIMFHLDFIVDYRDRGASESEAARMAIEAFALDWQERCGQIDELVDVFGMLPDDAKNTRWDQIRGLLSSSGWQEVLRIRRLIERLPDLVRIIRGLGRSRQSDQPDTANQATVEIMEEAIAQRPQGRTVRVPDMPGETRGIHRSGRIARMLPAEAMLLGHPRLRLVWHARRAERTLLTYEDDDRMEEIRLLQAPVMRPRPGPQLGKRAEMGPILVCVDTSGSMQGGAEAVAKAIVLEAMRTAQAQRRPCHVFAFGGPDELVELELGVDSGGIDRLTGFLGQAFRGGTDICGPLEKVIAKLEDQRWQLADLLIASDGEFGATAEIVARLNAIKQAAGLRVQGVLIGDRETVGLLEIADDIYPVRDWRRYGGSNADSPIHSHRLTAMYFPGALRTPENRRSTVSGNDASVAVRAGLHRGEPASVIAGDSAKETIKSLP
ncbi:MAG: VWA domain-containing protein [Rhodocyclales bacterium RIFCSPLOWO2_02_FULL_63_24]|nr:MAG: VWA domain-containing protein [Rhodocyclales bacterium RIFCSPLOWO2_02_FULL_63_24]